MKLRWGGLRTIQPGRIIWSLVVAAGAGVGLAFRSAVGRGRAGRHRVPALPAVLAGVASTWVGLWRVDSLRWTRSHVSLLLDLPTEVQDQLVDQLRSDGLGVEPWFGPRSVGGSSTGITCRLRDLRKVNAALDAMELTPRRR